MANKFQESVRQRREQDASKSEKPEKPEETVTAVNDLSSYIRGSTKRQAKNKTFYLDADLVEAIRVAALNQGVTESRLVNEVMRGVLGLKR